MQLSKGDNVPLSSTAVRLGLTFDRTPEKADIDVSAYLLGADSKVRGDEDMVFFNQRSAPGIRLDNDGTRFFLNNDRIDADIEKIAICVVIDGQPASTLGAIELNAGQDVVFRHDVSASPEAAIILAEVYRRNGEWKIRAVGQGFTGGMAPLARSFGMDVNNDPAPATPAPAAPPAPAPSAPVSLKKVTLEKKGSVSLKKGGGEIRARLHWEGRDDEGEGDLDFYCFYVMRDGTCGKKPKGTDAEAAPRLHCDGTFDVSLGEIEFKD